MNVFIGEAPPYWPGNYEKMYGNRTYFYHPKHVKPSSWFSTPKKIFEIEDDNKPEPVAVIAAATIASDVASLTAK